MKKQWYPYWEWEDVGMWRDVTKEESSYFLQKAIDFTGNAELYGKYMLKVIELYPIACRQNLTSSGTNKQAWIGHAACYLAIECPEQITREAWSMLTDEQRDEANKKADFAILEWFKAYEKENTALGEELGSQGVLGWNT